MVPPHPSPPRLPDPEPPVSSQLSAATGVGEGVSSVAIEGGALAGLGPSGLAAPARAPMPAVAAPYSAITDAEVMLRVKAGDDFAFDYLVEKYRRPLIGFMYRMAHNQALAEELAQEVFLRVYRSRQTYNADAKFTTWMYRIATNLAVNWARDTRQERAELALSLSETNEETGLALDVADSAATVEQLLVRDERLRAIRRQVLALPERQRVAVIMHKYQEMDYKQIGEVLKLSESATKSLLFRAYESLRERLKEFV